MDVVYRLSVYTTNAYSNEPVLVFRRIYERQSTARGVATQKRNVFNGRWGSLQFHHATIEKLTAIDNETETIWT